MVNKTSDEKAVGNKAEALPSPQPEATPSPNTPSESCHKCGGSGMLRLSDQRYRTCLECLGQGLISPLAGAITTANLWQGQLPKQSAPKPQLELNAVEFSSGAK